MASRIEPADNNIAGALVAVDASPGDSKVQEALGYAYLAHEMFHEAIGPFMRALEIGPTSVGLLSNLSTAQTMSGDGEGGEETARAAIAIDPASPSGYFCLGNALRRKGDPNGAIDAYGESLRRDQEDWFRLHTHHNLGLALEEAGHLREAVQEQEFVLRSRPKDRLAIAQASIVLEKLGDVEGAALMARRACEVDPNAFASWERLGWLLLEQARFHESIDAFRHVLELNPDSVISHNGLAAAFLNLGQPANALPYAERACHLAPDNEDAARIVEIARQSASDPQTGLA